MRNGALAEGAVNAEVEAVGDGSSGHQLDAGRLRVGTSSGPPDAADLEPRDVPESWPVIHYS